VEPARARISHIRLGQEDRANAILNSIKEGEDFAALAKELSEDNDTKDNGGTIQGDVLQGSSVPGIGDANEINERIFAADAPAVLQKPFKTENGWEVIKVDEKFPERQKGFDEVRQQVMMELLRRKRQDVQREFIEQMMDRYDVIIHTSVLAPTEPNEPAPQK
jgi:parvulin-like peptidyl-prolyl isomerase